MNLAPILEGVIAAVEAEGLLLRAEFFRPGGPRGANAKAPIDDEMEARLARALQALLAGTFVGEETGVTPGTLAGWVWMVDPHDGTREFLQGRRGSSISVGLVCEGRPVLGVVHVPLPPDRAADTIAWAEGCGPIRRNGRAIEVDLSERPLEGGIVWTTASPAFRPQFYSKAVAPARYIACPSIATRLARVAAGDGVATLSTHGVNEYDIAAGVALVRAAGGVVLDAEGREIAQFEGKLESRVTGCYAGAPAAARRLQRVHWPDFQKEPRRPPRVEIPLARADDEARLARAQGCLLGHLIGDSLGARVEGLSEGQPTDGGELALTLARAIVKHRGYGASAVHDAHRAGLAPDAASEANRSLMRCAPIGIWAAGDPQRAATAAREDSGLTHPNAVCVGACAGYAAAIAAGVGGAEREGMVAQALAHCSGPAQEAIRRAAAGEPRADFETHEGWVLVALQNAFRQLVHADDLEQGLVDTVGQGGDTDTNAAIAGALLGALHGRDAVPERWRFALLSCRPIEEAGAAKPRPWEFWPDDVLELAEALLSLRAR